MPDLHTYAIFSTRYAPATGGVESFTQRIAHQLAALGNKVYVVTSQLDASPVHEVKDDGVEVYRLPCRPFLNGRFAVSYKNTAYKRTLDELSTKKIDRVLVNNRFYRHSLEGVRFAQRIQAPVYVLDHGSAHLTFGNAVLDWFVERYEHAITNRMKAVHPYFAGISKASVAWLGHFEIETDVVIPNAIDVEAFKSVASNAAYKPSSRDGAWNCLVAFIGRLEPEKGALEFAQAAQILGSDFSCVMAGKGSLQKQIEGMHLENLSLVGQLDQADLSALLREAKIFCLPTRSEGYCTSLLEAASLGAIPVMPHVGGTDEVMGAGPVSFGVMLASTMPEDIASGIRAAQGLTSQSEELIAHVANDCTWSHTVNALETAFSRIE